MCPGRPSKSVGANYLFTANKIHNIVANLIMISPLIVHALRLALFALYLFVYALIFVIEFVIMAATCATGEKGIHLVLIKCHSTGIGVGVLVVVVMLTALAGGGVMHSVFGKIKRHSLILPGARGSERQASIRQLYLDRASS